MTLARKSLATMATAVALLAVAPGCSGHKAIRSASVRASAQAGGGGDAAGAAGATTTTNPGGRAVARGQSAGAGVLAPDRGLGPCGVPPQVDSYGTLKVPEGGAFAKPQNDFPITFKIKPAKGDRGSTVHMDVNVVTTQKTIIVVLANFLDQSDHDVHLSKFADAKGHAQFDVKIPAGVPMGMSRFLASASTRDNQSALDVQQFIVTGPGCR